MRRASQVKSFRTVNPTVVLLWLFQEMLKPERPAKSRQREQEQTDFSRIRCPLCKWQPNKSHRWYCADCDHPENFSEGCGTSWNTFTTRGRCPGCGPSMALDHLPALPALVAACGLV
jgi:hypothetical protein